MRVREKMVKKKRKAYTEVAEDAEIAEKKRDAMWRDLADMGHANPGEEANPRPRHKLRAWGNQNQE